LYLENATNKSVMETTYPTEPQLFKLHTVLTFFKNGGINWFLIEYRGDRILIKTDPLKGEIDIRVFYIDRSGEVDDDGFGEHGLY